MLALHASGLGLVLVLGLLLFRFGVGVSVYIINVEIISVRIVGIVSLIVDGRCLC